MPATVADLLQGKPEPVTVKPDDTLRAALGEMIKHDYSQLPVVDGDKRAVALITGDSILRALNNFGESPEALRVVDAMKERPCTCRTDEEIFEILDDLQKEPAVLVLDAREALMGIVTNYDTTNYFLRRAQDIMLVQDIEETIKDYILEAFYNGDETTDEAKLKAAIEEITPSNNELRKPFRKALGRYLELWGQADAKIDDKLMGQAFDEHVYRKDKAKPFEKLALQEYIELFLHQGRWSHYGSVLRLERDAIRRLLEAVRRTRNDLAHFRSDISEEQRDQLRFCRDWLGRHGESIKAVFKKNTAPEVAATAEATSGLEVASPAVPSEPRVARVERERYLRIFDAAPAVPVDEQPAVALDEKDALVPVDEETRPDESRYAPLAAWLLTQPSHKQRASLDFGSIERIIKSKLPTSAREHRAWWTNNPKGHPQTKQWVDAGWRVESVSLEGGYVVFTRYKEREKAYMDFFRALIDDLQKAAPSTFKTPSPTGLHWITVATLPEKSPKLALLTFAFTRTQQFRVEMYLDTGDQETTKQIFDALHERKQAIETAMGAPLTWERIDDKRASRIALYFPVFITDDEKKLNDVRADAVEAMVRFEKIMREQLDAVLTSISKDGKG